MQSPALGLRFRRNSGIVGASIPSTLRAVLGDGSKPELLFKYKEGTVTVTVYGPRIGWEWTRVNYHRWVQSTTEPGKFEKRPADREGDQVHLEKCVKAARSWFKQRDREREAAWKAN